MEKEVIQGTTTRVALYVRVSTEEQKNHGLSVDNQIQALREYCEQNGYIEVGLYNDAGISARKKYTRRPALLEMLDDCKKRKIDLILFTKLDRWFRSVADYYAVQSVLEECKVPWRAIWEDYDTETASGVFKVNIMLSVAQSEADRTSERIKAVNQFRRSQGQYTQGKAPLGYRSINGQIVIDEEKKDAVTAFFDKYLRTGSVSIAYQELISRGINIARTNAQKLLVNPTYYGDAHGVPCVPYITKEEHDSIVQSRANRRQRATKNPNRVYLFSGLIKCSICGNTFAGEYRKLKNGERKVYRCNSHREYRCTNEKVINECVIEEYLRDNIIAIAREYNATVYANKKTNDAEKKLTALNAKMRRILDMYEDGNITREEYIAKTEKIRAEIATIKIAPAKTVDIPTSALELYDQLDDHHKHEFWMRVLDHIEIDNKKNIKVFL